jgi:putative FmdB family regulatory protein
MPIYGFECGQCGHRYDRLQKLSDPDPTECPACGAVALRRQLTAPSFRLAGSGWYETDFKKDGDRKRNLAEGGDGAKSDAGGDGKSEPKTEAKGEVKTAGAESKSDATPVSKPVASPPPTPPVAG